MRDFPEGFYHIYSPGEEEPVLVHLYSCTDEGGLKGFGYNTHDGGGWLPLWDLKDDVRVVPVEIVEKVGELK